MAHFIKFQKQPQRLLAVGDIHGHLDKLQGLMEQVNPKAEDRVIFLGDYIDHGPDSKGVIEYLIDFKESFPQTVFLRGNHEQMLLDALVEDRIYSGSVRDDERKRLRDLSQSFSLCTKTDDDFGRFIDNGGQFTLDSYGETIEDIPEEHEQFLAASKFWDCESVGIGSNPQKFIFAHAGMYPGSAPKDQDLHDLLWLREPFTSFPMNFCGAIVVHGHTPDLAAPVFKKHRIGLDGGVRICGHLVCCDVVTHKFWRQP